MKKLALFTMIFALTTVLAACGDTKETTSQTAQVDTKQQETEAENQKLKEEAEALKKELAEKEAAEKKETEKDEEKPTVTAKMANFMAFYIPQLVEGSQIDTKTYDFLVEHPELFPAITAETKKEASKLVDSKVTSRHLMKSITPYLDKMIKVTGTAIQVQEFETDAGTMAQVHIMDDFGNSVIGIYNNSTGDILDGDNVTLRGVPTAVYSFENIGGGTTNAILLSASTVQKAQ